jgi:hypothetical protein
MAAVNARRYKITRVEGVSDAVFDFAPGLPVVSREGLAPAVASWVMRNRKKARRS